MSSAAGSRQDRGEREDGAAGDRHVRGGFLRRRRLLLWFAPVAVLSAAAAVLAVQAASYQPLGPGGSGGGSFPGLRTGVGFPAPAIRCMCRRRAGHLRSPGRCTTTVPGP